MELNGKNVGIALTGSFCTYEKTFRILEDLKAAGANLYPILSDAAQQISSRFGTPDYYLDKIQKITGREPILTIETAEPIGPSSFLDILAIVPCTGNTAAKLAGGITDSPVLMAAKAHLRVNKPLVIAISTNDGLGMNLKKHRSLIQQQKHLFRALWSGQLGEKTQFPGSAHGTLKADAGTGPGAPPIPARPDFLLNSVSRWMRSYNRI